LPALRFDRTVPSSSVTRTFTRIDEASLARS